MVTLCEVTVMVTLYEIVTIKRKEEVPSSMKLCQAPLDDLEEFQRGAQNKL